MPGDVRIYDGQQMFLAQDAQTNPSYMPDGFVTSSVNRTFRGGTNKTRPPFIEMTIATENADILQLIQSANFQGAMGYRSIKLGSVDGIIAAFGGQIIFFAIVNDKLYPRILGGGFDPKMMHVWFEQAEDIVYIQDGHSVPQKWSGIPTDPTEPISQFEFKMPRGTIMRYAHGRIHLTDRFERILSSDIIFGNGFTTTSNTENFTEIEYWAEGGYHVLPSNMGKITGMAVLPAPSANLRAQGELIVFSENGATSFDVSLPRAVWADAQIAKVVLIGQGCKSPWSVTTVNGEILYRSSEGWSMFSNSRYDLSNSLSYRKISAEVNRWVNEDTDWMQQFASAVFFDNRIICTVNPYIVKSDEELNSNWGYHRPHGGMIVMDTDKGAQASPDAGMTYRWNGLWTGPNPTQLLTVNTASTQRCFAFSFDNDNKNRIYELRPDGINDYVNHTYKKIKSYFITKKYDFANSGMANKFQRKLLNGGDVWTSDIKDRVAMSASYRADAYPCWSELMTETEFGCDVCDLTPNGDCEVFIGRPTLKKFKFSTPAIDCQIGQDIRTDMGAEFQVKVELSGSIQVDRLRLSCAPWNEDIPVGDCPSEDISCVQPTCCPDQDYEYYKIVDTPVEEEEEE